MSDSFLSAANKRKHDAMLAAFTTVMRATAMPAARGLTTMAQASYEVRCHYRGSW